MAASSGKMQSSRRQKTGLATSASISNFSVVLLTEPRTHSRQQAVVVGRGGGGLRLRERNIALIPYIVAQSRTS